MHKEPSNRGIVESPTDGMTIRAHAKVNLSLDIVGTLPDGYHELQTVFQALALHDLLTFEMYDGPFTLSCTASDVPTDERNLVWKAASLVWHRAGRPGDVRGVRAHLVKRIPAQGGLGGGSADGAAALVALDTVWGTGLGADGILGLARRLGADVPFFLYGGTALGLGRGDEIRPLDDLRPHAVVLVFPAFGVSTPEAFGWFDSEAGASRSPALPGDETIGLGGGGRLRVFNALQAPVSRRHPEIEALCVRLREQGADCAAMTGSGSTVFGLFSHPERAAAAAEALRAEGCRALLTRTATRRESEIRGCGGLDTLSARGPFV